MREWWSPAHFTVVGCQADAIVGGMLRLVIGEADGSRYTSVGRYLAVDAPRRLSFELAPFDDAGQPLFSVIQEVSLTPRGRRTRLTIRMSVTDPTPDAAPAIAGIPLGWEQVLDKLAAHLGGGA